MRAFGDGVTKSDLGTALFLYHLGGYRAGYCLVLQVFTPALVASLTAHHSGFIHAAKAAFKASGEVLISTWCTRAGKAATPCSRS